MEIITLPANHNHSERMGYTEREIIYAPYIPLQVISTTLSTTLSTVSVSELRERRFLPKNNNVKDYFNINKRFDILDLWD